MLASTFEAEFEPPALRRLLRLDALVPGSRKYTMGGESFIRSDLSLMNVILPQ